MLKIMIYDVVAACYYSPKSITDPHFLIFGILFDPKTIL